MDLAAILAAIVSAIVSLGSGGVAVYSLLKKAQAENAKAEAENAKGQAEVEAAQARNRTDELDYLFARYKETVDRVRKEHEEDRALLALLQAEHIHCREEMAALKERNLAQDRRLTEQDRELMALKRQLRKGTTGPEAEEQKDSSR